MAKPITDQTQVLEIFAETEATYEKGAKFLALLTYPALEDAGRRRTLQNALCYKALWDDHLAHPGDQTPITAKPQYLFANQNVVESQFKRVAKTVEQRLIAGRIAMAFLQRAELGDKMVLPPEVKRLSIDQMVSYVAATEGYKHAENLETRRWRPTRQIIHFAAALAAVGQERARQKRPISLNHLLADNDLLADIIERAVMFAKLIEMDNQFPVNYKELIQVRIS